MARAEAFAEREPCRWRVDGRRQLAVAEGGAAGPTFRPKGLDSGFSAIAVAARSPDGIKVVRQTLCESPHARRGDNMERFATAAARETNRLISNAAARMSA